MNFFENATFQWLICLFGHIFIGSDWFSETLILIIFIQNSTTTPRANFKIWLQAYDIFLNKKIEWKRITIIAAVFCTL